jgi:K+-sensing histidine kinase KdpD
MLYPCFITSLYKDDGVCRMNREDLSTEHAPAERASNAEVERQFNKLNSKKFVKQVLDAVPSMTAILNAQRQIISTNQQFSDFFGFKSYGDRHGEALNCIHSRKNNGCGTTTFCQTCGAIASILQSQKTDELAECEVRMSCFIEDKTSALDFRVWSQPMEVEGEKFTILSLLDISHEKRRHALERIFFHDIMNTAGGIQGVSRLLMEAGIPEEEVHELADLLNLSSEELIDEIQEQKTLSYAEADELVPVWKTIGSRELLEQVHKQYRKHPLSENKHIIIHPSAQNFTLQTDITLICRVLGNLTKNGLEASSDGDEISLQCQQGEGMAVFTVKNAGVMPIDVQLQIFNRSFSTKGIGRGLGTYSIKLLVERYLNGAVSFVSSEEEGTIFKVEIPLDLPRN